MQWSYFFEFFTTAWGHAESITQTYSVVTIIFKVLGLMNFVFICGFEIVLGLINYFGYQENPNITIRIGNTTFILEAYFAVLLKIHGTIHPMCFIWRFIWEQFK